MTLTIVSLHIYPVKSLRGVSLKSATLAPRGLAHDREWMAIDEGGRFLTQRNLPNMAQITTRLEDDQLILGHHEHEPCAIPLQACSTSRLTTEVWGDRCEVVEVSEPAAIWLQKVLQTPGRPKLVRMAPEFERPQRHPERFTADVHTRFADSSPFLVTNLASLETLNEALQAQGHDAVPMNRFRPNIVIQGLSPFAEQEGGTLYGPGYSLRLSYPCERCVVTTIDQVTGERNAQRQPFRLLQTLNPMPGDKKGPAFGMQTILENTERVTIKVGDELQLSHDNHT